MLGTDCFSLTDHCLPFYLHLLNTSYCWLYFKIKLIASLVCCPILWGGLSLSNIGVGRFKILGGGGQGLEYWGDKGGSFPAGT